MYFSNHFQAGIKIFINAGSLWRMKYIKCNGMNKKIQANACGYPEKITDESEVSEKKEAGFAGLLQKEMGQQNLERNIDLKIRIVIMLVFRASQDRKILTVVLIMLGVHKIHIAKAETQI